jgi:predicted CopG family antitoxin
MSKTIRVEEGTYELLSRLKGDDESFDDAIERLVALRRERIEEGAGFWAETDGAEKARSARKSMKEDVGTNGTVR